MSLLLMRRTTPPKPEVVDSKLRGRHGVKLIIMRASPYEKHDLAWWQAWLAEHWA